VLKAEFDTFKQCGPAQDRTPALGPARAIVCIRIVCPCRKGLGEWGSWTGQIRAEVEVGGRVFLLHAIVLAVM